MITAIDLLKAFACANAGCQCQKSLKRGKGRTHCPGHSDTNPSLDVTDMDGKVLFMCHGKCVDQATTLRALQERGFFKKSERKSSATSASRAKRNETRHIIRGTDGSPLAVHIRQDIAPGDKKLWWETPNGGKGLGGIKTADLLYGLELLAQQPGEPIVLAEGEKAAEALRAVGVLALATTCGASETPSTEVLANLANRRVFLWPDNDEPGGKHMERTGNRLHQVGCELFMVEWPDAPLKGDAADCPPEQLASLIAAAARWEPEPPEDGAALLDATAAFLGRFVAFPSPEALVAAALWVMHAHGVEYFESTPRLALLSPEKQSGKTRTLEVIELLAPRARHTSSLTAAALFRLVGAEQPTILMDEADTYFRPGDQTHEELRGLINAGHRKGAVAYRCVGQQQEVRAFPAYAAVALAGIGDLPDTVLDRAVLVRMRRRAPDEPVEPLRHRVAAPEGAVLAARLAKWVEAKSAELQEAWPAMPAGLTDRPADCWEPLLAIADIAGGDWPTRARAAALKVNDQRQQADPSLGVRLLADVRTLIGTRKAVTSAGLVQKLVDLVEAPWGDLKGKPLDQRGLARRLKPYGIQPKQVRVQVEGEEKQLRGYERADFLDAWKRYLPSSPKEASQTSRASHASSKSGTDEAAHDGYQPSQESEPSQEFEFAATDVTDVTDFSEASPNGWLIPLHRVDDNGDIAYRMYRPPGELRCCLGLWATLEAAAEHARSHGFKVVQR